MRKAKQDISLVVNDIKIPKTDVPDFTNDYFSNIGSTLVSKCEEPTGNYGAEELCHEVLPQIDTSEDELLKLIKELNIYKSSAIEIFSSKVLKVAFQLQLTRLVRIFNISLINGCIPDSWKCAMVIQLHRRGALSDLNDFRTVSLLPIQGK